MEFRHNKKVIQFSGSMVNYAIGFPSGRISVSTVISQDLSSSTKILMDQYVANGITTRQALMSLLLDNHDEVTFIQQFAMFSIATVLCPGFGDQLNLDYLSCMVDVSKITSYNSNSYVLDYLGAEILKFQSYIDTFDPSYPPTKFNVRGCLALLAVSSLYIMFSLSILLGHSVARSNSNIII